MTDPRASAIQSSFARMGDDPRALAADVLTHLSDQGLLDHQWVGPLRERKNKNLAGALALVVRNADLVETITGVMSRSAVSPFLSGMSPAYHEAVRGEFHAALRQADPQAWDETLERDWFGVVRVVADSVFGPSPATADHAAA